MADKLTQDVFTPGIIKPRFLVAGENPAGSIYVSDGTNFTLVEQGTNGQVLTSDGNGGFSYTTPTPPPTPVIGISGSNVIPCTVNTTINSGTPTDITGATTTFSPSASSYILVTAFFDIAATTAGDVFLGYLTVDGSQQSAVATFLAAANNDRKTVGQTWRVSLSAASHTIKLQGVQNSGSGSATYNADHTRFTYLLFNQ